MRSALGLATRVYAPPGDLVRLRADAGWVFDLAGMLWDQTAAPPRETIEIVVRTEDRIFSESAWSGADAGGGGSSRGEDLALAFEESQQWTHGEHEFRCAVPGALDVTVDLALARAEACIRSPLPFFQAKNVSLSAVSPSVLSFLSRTLLEAPAAVLLGRRGWQVLHAGAVVGPRGAAVLRGPSGAGKSTLVAAAHRAGLGVLGDESLFVSRRDPDALAASVRDLALREDAARLLGIFDATQPAFTGRETKRRVDLFHGSVPRARSARRVAGILLGPREPGPAALVPLRGEAFVDAFRAGGIPQEHPGDPDSVARAWASDGWLLSGASDLEGAVRLLKGVVT